MKKLLLIPSALCLISSYIFAQATLTFTTSQVDASVCTAPCNGTATVNNVTGGTPPYNYYWGTSPAQQTQTATGLCPGTYTIGVYDSGTPFPAYGNSQVTITCTQGVNEYVLNNFVEIYPNPASVNISIALSHPNVGMVSEVSVFNTIGEKVLSETFTSSKKFSNSLYVRNLTAGTYFLELKDEKNTYKAKFIKQ